MRLCPVITLVACLFAASVEASEDGPRALGRLQVVVESVTWTESDARCSDSSPCLLVVVRASGVARSERARIRQAAVLDVRGRRFDAERDAPSSLRAGATTFAFAVPEHAAVVSFELNGTSFEIAHAGRMQDSAGDFSP